MGKMTQRSNLMLANWMRVKRESWGKYFGIFPATYPGKVGCFRHVCEKLGGKIGFFFSILGFLSSILRFLPSILGFAVLNFVISVYTFGIFALNVGGKVLVFLPEYLPL